MKNELLTEVNRALEIMGLELISEQETELQVGDVKDGKVFQGYKTKEVEESFNEIGMYSVNKDDPSKFLNKFVQGIIATITSDADMKKALDEGNLQLATATIRSGASNWYRTPLKPEVPNDIKNAINGEPRWNWYDSKGMLDKLSDNTTDDWKNNKALAQRRSTKFLAALKQALLANTPPIKIFPAIKETVTSSIVDTGGMTDEKCKRDSECSKFFPKPGQFVEAKLAFAYEKGEAIWEDFEECLGGMKITIAYIVPVKKYQRRMKKGNWSGKGKRFKTAMNKTIVKSQTLQKQFNLQQSSQQHCCNKAKFTLWLNNQKIGGVNLDNNDSKDLCGARVKTITVSPEQATAIAEVSPDKKLRLSMKGRQSDTHSEVPLVKVVNGRGQVIFNGEPGLGNVNFDKKRNIFKPFSPCEKITA